MNNSIDAVRIRLEAALPYVMQASTTNQKMSPIYDWCLDQYGADLITQFKISNGLESDTSFKIFLRQWPFHDRDLAAARWEYCDCFFFFKYTKDAILFRLAWPCRVKTFG